MKKSTVNLVKTLNEKLLVFPVIVKSLEKKDISFINQLFLWINQTEEILTTYSISEVSELSGLKSKIIAPKFSENRSVSIKKMQLKVAAESLYEIQHIVLEVLNPLTNKIEECRELIRQLLLLVSQTNTIKYNHNLPFEDFINNIWQFIINNEQLKPGAIKLKTSLIMTDIQLLIADELNLSDF
jgi:hypothetical protein